MKKSCNFTKAEIEVLVNEVDLNKETLFGKLNMQLTADMKKKCWEGIANKVNEVGAGEVRSEKAVHKKWTGLTSRTKKAEAGRRREMFATGAGEYSQATASDMELKVINLMGNEVIEGVVPGMDFGLLQPGDITCMSLGDSTNVGVDPVGTQTVYVSVVAADVIKQSITVATQTEKSGTDRKRNLGNIEDVAEIEKRRLKVEGVLTIAVQIVFSFCLSVHNNSSKYS